MSKIPSVEVELVFPVEHDGRTYDKLSIRRPKVKDLIQAERQPGEVGRMSQLLAICSGVPFPVVGEMYTGDFYAACARSGLGFLSEDGPGDLSAGPSSSSTPGPAGDSPSS